MAYFTKGGGNTIRPFVPVVAVRVESDPGCEDDWVELVLDLDVGVAVGVEHLLPLARPVPHPLVQPRTEVLKQVRLRELGALGWYSVMS